MPTPTCWCSTGSRTRRCSPLLYQVATAGLNPGDVSYALRAVAGRARNARVRQAAVTAVDAGNRRVRTDTGEDVEYDYLVLGCGVTANFFGVPGADVHARTIDTPGDAVALRDLLFTRLEAAAQGRPGAVEPVVVIVGAGPTGVELAGALAELRHKARPVMYPELDLELPNGLTLRGRTAWLLWVAVHVAGLMASPNRLRPSPTWPCATSPCPACST